MTARLRLFIAPIVIASGPGTSSAFHWCHPCLHHSHGVTTTTGGGVGFTPIGVTPVGASPVGVSVVGFTPVGIPSTTVTGGVGFSPFFFNAGTTPTNTTNTTPIGASPFIGANLPVLTQLVPQNPQNQPNPTPNPTPASCATTADVKKLLDERFAKAEGDIADIKNAVVGEAKIREIVAAEVKKQLGDQLADVPKRGELKKLLEDAVAAGRAIPVPPVPAPPPAVIAPATGSPTPVGTPAPASPPPPKKMGT